MQNRRWTEEETILALYLYYQLPYGQLHSGNVEIRKLANDIDRTPSSVAMKLANLASLDPKITNSGRKGLDGASKLDREMSSRFQHNWASLVNEAERIIQSQNLQNENSELKENRTEFEWQRHDSASSVQRLTEQRVGQDFFRRAVISNFDECCCVTGISDRRLLNASHIAPWGLDIENRLNPANGLSLSATFDRAFDRGLLTVYPSGKIEISRQLLENDSFKTRAYFAPYQGRSISSGIRFDPDPKLLAWHNKERFVDA
ncbi:HNH endonuclease [Sphingorhabdus contaminans]|uniref:HNH endonuclease n=1 Tax=Sphingorhabdus contaminans TaxID=1343899 RepID=UPI003D288F24